MGPIAAILLAGGLVALFVGGYLKLKGGRITKTPLLPTGQAAGHRDGLVSVQGAVRCAEPLIAPASGTPCLYYALEVVGSWKAGDSRKSKKYVEQKHAAAFTLDDGSGGVGVDLTKGGDMGLERSFSETQKEGLLADLKSAVKGRGEAMQFGGFTFQNPTMSKADRFECVERIVPVPERAFALGKIDEAGRVGPSGVLGVMFSAKSREELLGASAKNAKLAFLGGAAAAAVGGVLGLITLL
ncbi:MAG TPA: GIDE domain-containing protein [Polyangiaceae bacterium LLY-WYZ-15_(1-7)]|nr:hypothetical protein [Myxococcales bacterium]MAT28786.1 hypothetical protein [Sandaracinus sp.]HJL02983.1 GIDE domain-containing protein [Polyangiaceae bacterium LLY-WYZ-15_(1-7)]HJL13629.1 GIDE domain-containing protein [Polyangiaceae bacterium LLY-WYZ-15_(1-7)]HJL21289.1 GIDE domain-containing protein [Polyangiaceae bacterium LLY-WYZ-15_(1-7)]